MEPDEVVEIRIGADQLPEGAVFSNFEEYTVQELKIFRVTTLLKRARYKLPDGTYITAPLPEDVDGHFGTTLKTYIVTQYHLNNVTQNKIHADLQSLGFSISEGTIDAILQDAAKKLEPEHAGILKAAKEVARGLYTDDTGGKHNGKNHYHIVIQNELFTYIHSTPNKSRLSFLHTLQGKTEYYVLNEHAIAYLERCKINKPLLEKVKAHTGTTCATEAEWKDFWKGAGIDEVTTGKKNLINLTEAGLIGALIDQGLSADVVLVSDNAPQFKKVFAQHGFCWVHALRAIKQLIMHSETESVERERVLDEGWDFYRQLDAFRACPTEQAKAELEKKFDTIFLQNVQSQRLLEVLRSIHNMKKGLLCVLDCPRIELHNNSSERDIRPLVCKRKISGSTRNDIGYLARSAFASIKKTCQKLGIAAREYIRDRLRKQPKMESLGNIIRARAAQLSTSSP